MQRHVDDLIPVVERITLTYRRRIPHPVDEAYQWLTDYDDQDPERTHAIITERPVLERREDVVVLDVTLDVLGRHIEGRAEVDLMPPDRWRARAIDEKGREADVYEYRLEPRDDGETSELIVDYHFIAPKLKHKLQLKLGKPLIRLRIHQMWNGFMAAMDEELADQGPSRDERPTPAGP